jgi:hypothetical protein
VTPRPSMKPRRATTARKRAEKGHKVPLAIDSNDPNWAEAREGFIGEPLSPEDSEAVLRWIATGKGRPRCV